MLGHRRLRLLVGALALSALGLVMPIPARAAECTLLRVENAKEATLRVYFTRFDSEDKTGGRYKNCKIVKSAAAGTQTFAITKFRQDANLIVHPENWPK